MENKNYTDKKFWDDYFNRHKHKPSIVENSLFSDIFNKYLTPDPNKTVLEIGCADSNFLCYLSKKLGYRAFGIDYAESIERTRNIFRFNGLPEPTLHKGDVFTWTTDMKFDLVCSFGFIEHFSDLNGIIVKHADFVAPGGKLVISMPNFTGIQYFFHWLIDRENLKKHNTKIMNLNTIKKSVENTSLKIEYLSYYKTFGFWTEKTNMASWEKSINWSILKFGKIINKLFGYDRPNPLFSPHIVCIATKK